MAGRLPGSVPKLEAKWSLSLGKELSEFLNRLKFAMGGLQGPPDTPSTIQAGAVADAGTSQAPMPSDAVHAVDTAAPTVPVASVGGTASEGTGTALMRADAGLILSDDLEMLMWMGC